MDLKNYTKCGGCSAKFSAGALNEVLKKINVYNPDILVGFEDSDDASVYKISDEFAIVQTIDFFPPMVDDPYIFGQIAVANAISDIYAMGGEPKIGQNILEIPQNFDKNMIYEILKGGNDKAKEAGVSISGGHTIEDEIPKYGLSVTGFINPKNILKNSNARENDVLILTKPLGIGIINTAKKVDMISEEIYHKTVKYMTILNKYAKEIMLEFDVKCCTDVTGFGLLGHTLEVAKASNLSIKIETKKLPIIEQAKELVSMGIMSKAVYSNKEFCEKYIEKNDCKDDLLDIMLDPQTSGGLLIFVPENQSEKLLEKLLENENTNESKIIGRVLKKAKYSIIIE